MVRERHGVDLEPPLAVHAAAQQLLRIALVPVLVVVDVFGGPIFDLVVERGRKSECERQARAWLVHSSVSSIASDENGGSRAGEEAEDTFEVERKDDDAAKDEDDNDDDDDWWERRLLCRPPAVVTLSERAPPWLCSDGIRGVRRCDGVDRDADTCSFRVRSRRRDPSMRPPIPLALALALAAAPATATAAAPAALPRRRRCCLP